MLVLLIGYQLTLARDAPEAGFDLRQVDPSAQAADTIVITGRRQPSQRLLPLPGMPEPPRPRMEIWLPGHVRLGTDVAPDAGGSPASECR